MALSPDEKQKINPGLAAVLSFIFSGLGQIYNGEILKGLVIMLFSAIGMILIIVGFVQVVFCIFYENFGEGDLLLGGILAIMGLLLITTLGIYNIYDAYNAAKEKLGE